MTGMAERVARRVMLAKDFPTEDALRQYLKEHPDATKSNHTVNKAKPKGGPADKPTGKKPPPLPKKPPPLPGKTKPPPIPPQAKGKPKPPPLPGKKPPPIPEEAKKPSKQPEKAPAKPKAPEPPAKTKEDSKGLTAPKPGRLEAWKTRFKNLSDSGRKFVEESPKAVKHFFGDEEFRKHTLAEAKDAIVKAPKKLKHNLIETAKEEVHEYKEAAAGVKRVLTGKKMSKHQKKAVKTVALHMSIGVAAAAFAASGPLMGAGIFAKNLARHVALKSMHKTLGDMHLLEESAHVGHGVVHMLSHLASEKEQDADDALADLVMARVTKEIEQLSDQDFEEVLNSLDKKSDETADDAENDDDSEGMKEASQRIVARFLAAQNAEASRG